MFSWRAICAAGLALALVSCAAKRPPVTPAVAPKYPAYVKPPVPDDLAPPAGLRQRFDDGWNRLQSGDLRGAGRDFGDVLKQAPGFYPADAALGDLALIDKDAKAAFEHFAAALEKNGRYLPALDGRVLAALALGDEIVTASALEQLLAVDPSREEARTRLDLMRLRIVQSELAAAAKFREAGRLDEAQATLDRALGVSPSSPVLLRELTKIDLARGALGPAEQHARRAMEADTGDAESLALLGTVLELEGKTAEAADVFNRALDVDPRPAWRDKRDALRGRVAMEALPAEYRAVPAAPTVTRAQVAAVIGIELGALVNRVDRSDRIPPWTFGLGALMRNLAARGLLGA